MPKQYRDVFQWIILAILLIIITACQTVKDGHRAGQINFRYDHGAIIRADQTRPQLALVFTGDSYGDGGEIIRGILAAYKVPAAFFLTGNFYRLPDFKPVIEGLHADGHYLGAHSDRHLLYCTWENRDSLLVTREQFRKDLENNYAEMKKFGISKEDAPYFLPPYEWSNQQIADWSREFGVQLINYTPGTRSHADYTTPDMGSRYVPSDSIMQSIQRYDRNNKNGLNGFILLLHIGTHPDRTDKFYNRLGELIQYIQSRGMRIVPLKELLR